MMLASGNPIEHVADQPWPGCNVSLFGMNVTLMSSGIAVMILVALLLAVVLVVAAQRRRPVPTGVHNVLEAIVVFVRNMIAVPTLRDRADAFLPFLLTLFVFVLGLNLFGMVPIQPIVKWLVAQAGWPGGREIGGTATSIPAVCAGLASLTLLTIIGCGLWRAALRKHEKDNWSMPLALAASPMLWLGSLSPSIPGPVGKVLLVPLALLELIGAIAKCFALMIRLAANMMAGHILLAVLMMFVMRSASNALHSHPLFLGVSFLCVLGAVAATMIDLLVSGLQAYIFTFLTAMFLGLYVEPSH